MGWLLLESLVALLILVAIVAWTVAPLRRRRKRSDDQTGSAPPDA
jgi:hypothetical protein